MHYLSICAFIKDEHAYLPEWIEFHRLLGVEHFFIYDNGSAIPIARTLEEDVCQGIVTVTPFPGRAQHIPAYQECLNTHRNASQWMAFIDTDEFLHPSEGEDLRSLLVGFEEHAGLGVNWVMFGSSGHLLRPEGLQIERFTMRPPDGYPPNTHIKSVMQLQHTKRALGTHHFHPVYGRRVVNECFRDIDGPFSPFSVEKIRINHYWTRSRQEFADKIGRGRSDGMPDRVMEDLVGLDSQSTFEDRSIQRFVQPVKDRLARRKAFNA